MGDEQPPAPGLGRPARRARRGRRERIRSTKGLGELYRVGVFAAGLACIALGLALAVLPGPLTIPPILLGLWIWSTEFAFAERFFETFKRKGREAWAHAKRHPVTSAAATVGGLVAAAAVIWAVGHFDLVGRAREIIGV